MAYTKLLVMGVFLRLQPPQIRLGVLSLVQEMAGVFASSCDLVAWRGRAFDGEQLICTVDFLRMLIADDHHGVLYYPLLDYPHPDYYRCIY